MAQTGLNIDQYPARSGRLIKEDGSTVNEADGITLAGSTLQEQKTEADAVGGAVTFSAPIQTLEIYNTDPTNTGTFTVNGIVITVPSGKVFKSAIGGTPSSSVSVSTAATYILSRYQ